MDDPTNLRPDDSIRVAEIRAALIQEMRAEKETPASTVEDVRELKADALNALRHTIRHSPNEALKARTSMWALDKIIEAERVNDDPMAEFLRDLTNTRKEEVSS